jgi:predicted amidohydrolase YtcJ
MRGLGDLLETMDLRGVSSVEEVARRVKAKAASLPAGTWIRGRNWDQTNWGGKFPVAGDLGLRRAGSSRVSDPQWTVTPDGRIPGHWRQAASRMKTKDPAGGQILRDSQPSSHGVLVDRAQGLVSRKMPPLTDAQVEACLSRAAKECARLGMTTVHDAGISRRSWKPIADCWPRISFPSGSTP